MTAIIETYACRTEVGQEVELVFKFDRAEDLTELERELRNQLVMALLDQQRITITDSKSDRVWANCLVTDRRIEGSE